MVGFVHIEKFEYEFSQFVKKTESKNGRNWGSYDKGTDFTIACKCAFAKKQGVWKNIMQCLMFPTR